jgi:hypothetical protein
MTSAPGIIRKLLCLLRLHPYVVESECYTFHWSELELRCPVCNKSKTLLTGKVH